jgi:hypothetical protein
MPYFKAMEYWNNGMLEYWFRRIEIYLIWMALIKINIRTSSAFNTHYSIFPPFHYSIGNIAKPHPCWVKAKSGPAR